MTTQIPLAHDLVPLVLSGKKTSTVRLGMRNYALGPGNIVSGSMNIPIEIVDVEYAKVFLLTEGIAKTEGYQTLEQLLSALKRFYPEATPDRDVTIVRFRRA